MSTHAIQGVETSDKSSSSMIFITSLFMFLLFIGTFNSSSQSFKNVGLVSILTITFLSVNFLLLHYASVKRILPTQSKIIMASLAFLVILLVGAVNDPSIRSLVTTFQFFSIMTFFTFSCLIIWDDQKIKLAKRISMLFILLLPVMLDITFIGAHLAFALFFILLQKKRSLVNVIFVIGSCVLIYLTGARAVLILLAATFVTFMFWNYITKTLYRYFLAFLLIVTGIMSFIFIYPKMIYWSNFYEINNFVIKYTGGRLMSGREMIWNSLANFINKRPLVGHGTGVSPSEITNLPLSSHNLYIQVALQNGYIGLAILLVIFLVIWFAYFKSKTSYSTRLSASFFVGILIYSSFEVVLTQNKLDTAMMFWLIISIGVSNSLLKEETPSYR